MAKIRVPVIRKATVSSTKGVSKTANNAVRTKPPTVAHQSAKATVCPSTNKRHRVYTKLLKQLLTNHNIVARSIKTSKIKVGFGQLRSHLHLEELMLLCGVGFLCTLEGPRIVRCQ